MAEKTGQKWALKHRIEFLRYKLTLKIHPLFMLVFWVHYGVIAKIEGFTKQLMVEKHGLNFSTLMKKQVVLN